MAETGWTDKRPMSPHLSVWRWHITMAGSIFHRMSGIGNSVGLVLLVGWLVAAAMGPDAYDAMSGVIGSLPGRIILAAFTLSLVYHLLNGVRHLFLDAGKGFSLATANLTGWIVLGASAVVAAVIVAASGLLAI
jgi:succinate dehydrogenase / fumarate reductase cytochrome b subunit